MSLDRFEKELHTFIDYKQYTSWLLDRYGIWQMRFLDGNAFSSYASSHGVSLFFDHSWRLWFSGLLKADYIKSTIKIWRSGLIQLGGKENGKYYYADDRVPRRRKNGWGSAFVGQPEADNRITPYFHPFRIYVMYNIQRMIKPAINPMQMFVSNKRYPDMIKKEVDIFNTNSAKNSFVNLILKWNSIATLCILAEPLAYERIWGKSKRPAGTSYSEQKKLIDTHGIDVKKIFRKLGLSFVEEMRKELSFAFTTLEPNDTVRTILRLMNGKYREGLTGNLGASVLFQTMAETLRLVAEDEFSTELVEEDGIQYGPGSRSINENLYGSPRILDGGRKVKNDFLRQFGLDYSERIRWYVEGETEFGAFSAAIGKYPAIELVNLRGNFIEGKGKGLSFRESLREDLKISQYSCISLDADNDDYVRAVKKAAQDDDICGLVWLSTPDFEFYNFSLPELEEVLWCWAIEIGVDLSKREILHKELQGTNDAKDLWNKVHKSVPEMSQCNKGKGWGKKLLLYADQNPEWHIEKGKNKPLLESIGYVIHSVNTDYFFTRKKYTINPETLELVQRKKA